MHTPWAENRLRREGARTSSAGGAGGRGRAQAARGELELRPCPA